MNKTRSAALIVFVFIVSIGVFLYYERNASWLAPWLGTNTTSSPTIIGQAAYACDANRTITATYYSQAAATTPPPGQPPVPSGSVAITLSDGRAMRLPQTISASGIRYANADESFVFWSKGATAFVAEGVGNTASQTYANCISTIATSPKNATYVIEGQPVTLVDGVFATSTVPGSASRATTHYFGNEATGDLNGDGLLDVGFILTQNNGGSGTFYYVAVALKTATGYQGTNAILLGDRIAPQTTEIKNGVLIVNYADRNPGEPMTAQPSVGVSKYLLVEKGSLVAAPAFATVLYPLYPGVRWGPAEATSSPDYGAVAVMRSTPFTGITDIASKSTPFMQYYHDRLLAAGWIQDMSREAGGPGAEVSIYTKGNQFIVTSFHSLFHMQQQNTPSQCPCDVQFTLMSGLQK